MRVCIDCPRLIPHGTRCPEHRLAKNRARGTRAQQGYGPGHRKLRNAYARRMAAGETFTCWRCGATINPDAWHLGHDDNDRSIYRGPECIPCNLATSTRRTVVGGAG